MNEDKNGVKGYIGANATAELIYIVTQNLRKNRGVEVKILKVPNETVAAYDEVANYLRLGWAKVYQQ